MPCDKKKMSTPAVKSAKKWVIFLKFNFMPVDPFDCKTWHVALHERKIQRETRMVAFSYLYGVQLRRLVVAGTGGS